MARLHGIIKARTLEVTTAGDVVVDSSKANAVVLHKAKDRVRIIQARVTRMGISLNVTRDSNRLAHPRHPRMALRDHGSVMPEWWWLGATVTSATF